MFAIGIFFHYPQQILHIESPSLLSFLGLTNFTVERVFFLAPIIYAGVFFSLRISIYCLIITLVIILPRIFLISEFRVESFLEIGAALILGALINLWLEAKRKESTLVRQLVARLEESERVISVSEQKYRYLFENATDAIWVQDINGLFMEANRAFEKLTGFKADELKGINLAKFLNPESLALAREVRAKLTRGEELQQPYEQQFFIKDGSVKTVKMSTNAIIAGGKITGFEHIARDVTLEKQQQENVRSYIQQITMAQEEERKRIARDLHDDVSPDFLVLIQKLDELATTPRPRVALLREKLQELRKQTEKSLESLRETAQGLRPRILDDLGLVAALEWIGEELEKDQNIKTRIEAKGIDRKLSPEIQIVLFRIAQEALNNIRKHAGAAVVTIKVENTDNDITMTITDDGQGFEVPARVEDMVREGRLGLMGMYERATLLNGNFHIKSSPGLGTRLTITLPWQVED